MKKIVTVFYYYCLISASIALILADATAFYEDQFYITAICLVINLIVFTFAYYQLFMQDKDDQTLFENILLKIMIMIIIIGSILVLLNTNYNH